MNIMNICDGNDKIIDTISVDGSLLIFTKKTVLEVETADSIDPQNIDSSTRHSNKKIYDIGASNPYLARCFLQFEKIINSLKFEKNVNKQDLLNYIWGINKNLLDCEKAHYKIYKEVISKRPRVDELINSCKEKSLHISNLPQIEDLESSVRDFLLSSKKFLLNTYRILSFFYTEDFDRIRNVDELLKLIKKDEGLEVNNSIVNMVKQDEGWLKIIMESRNAIEHEEDGQKIIIKNFTLYPGNKFSDPSWRYILTKKRLGEQKEFSDIVLDMATYMQNMLTFFEEFLLLTLKDSWDKNLPFIFYKKPDDKISKDCPMVYELSMDINPKKGLKAPNF